MLAAVSLALAMPAAAFTPYTPYTYDSYGHSTPSANGYEAETTVAVAELGLTGAAADLHCTADRVYVLAENGVAVLDKQLRPIRLLDAFTYQGQTLTLNRPRGLFVLDNAHILIADTENRRVLECDETGAVSRILEKPARVGEENKGYLEKLDFRPIKVLYAGREDIYVLVENCYLGILRYSADGTFHGFFAANQVEASLSQMIDKLWKKLLTKQQRSYIANYVPVDYSSFDIDGEGFIYTTTSRSNSTLDEIRKLNTVGKNILRTDMQYDTLGRGDYGDRDKLVYRQKSYDSKLIDVAASDDGVFAALDQQRGRVFVYDQDSNLLFAFGGSGEQKGLFRQAAAIDYLGDSLLVLDGDKGALTAFQPTQFGRLVLEATRQNAAGRYDLALEPWQEALRLDASYENAYRGIGQGLYVSGAAMKRPCLTCGAAAIGKTIPRPSRWYAAALCRPGFIPFWRAPPCCWRRWFCAAESGAPSRAGKRCRFFCPWKSARPIPCATWITGFDGCAVQRAAPLWWFPPSWWRCGSSPRCLCGSIPALPLIWKTHRNSIFCSLWPVRRGFSCSGAWRPRASAPCWTARGACAGLPSSPPTRWFPW